MGAKLRFFGDKGKRRNKRMPSMVLRKEKLCQIIDIQQAHPIRKGAPFISLTHDVTSVTWHTGT